MASVAASVASSDAFGSESSSTEWAVFSQPIPFHDSESLFGDRSGLDLAPTRALGKKGTITTILKSFTCLAVLLIPHGFMQAGLFGGLLVVFFGAALNMYASKLLVEAQHELVSRGVAVLSFVDLGFATFGENGRRVAEGCVAMAFLGFVAAENLLVARVLQVVLTVGTGCQVWSIYGCIALLWIILLPFVFVRHLSRLVPVNAAGAAANFVVAFAVVCAAIATLRINGVFQNWTCVDGGGLCVGVNPRGFFTFFGAAVFLFMWQPMIAPISIATTLPQQYFTRTMLSMEAALGAFYCVVGVLGLLAWGTSVHSVALGEVPARGLFAVLQLLVVVEVIGFTAVYMYPLAKMADRAAGFAERHSGKKLQKNVIRFLLMFVILLIQLLGSADVNNLTAIVGGMFCIPVFITLPLLFHMRVFGATYSSARSIAHNALVVFSTGVGLLATVDALVGWGRYTNFNINCVANTP